MPVSQSDFPDVWAADCEDKGVKVEVAIPQYRPTGLTRDQEAIIGYQWIEIPTFSVELMVEKGRSATIQRAAKVHFPIEWGRDRDSLKHNSPRQLLGRVDDFHDAPFLFSRVQFQRPSGEWVLSHFGWMGGIGSTANNNEGKFWVYDVSELMEGAATSITFNNPTVARAAQLIGDLIVSQTPIPLTGVTLVPPQTEKEYAVAAEKFFEEDLSDTPYAGGTPSTGPQPNYYGAQPAESTVDDPESVEDFGGQSSLFIKNEEDEGTPNYRNRELGTKTFQRNHDTIQDVIDWFESSTGAKAHFEPTMHGVNLVFDIEPSRRIWAAESVLEHMIENQEGNPFEDESDLETELDPTDDPTGALVDTGPDSLLDYTFHGQIHIRENDALYEMRPVNTVRLRGSSNDSLITEIEQSIDDNALISEIDEEFPVVEVQAPSLVQAADGFELAPETIESNAKTIEEAKREAIRRLREEMNTPSDGEIFFDGHPNVQPYDGVDAFEVCDGTVEYEQSPVRYEVESVRHIKEAGSTYETRILVSVWANEETIEVTQARMVGNNPF